MKNFSLIILFLLSLCLCDEFYQMEDDVLVLNEETFGIAIRENKYILVLFFDPLCENCQALMPEFQKAATTLKKENLFLAKIDATIENKISDRYEIETLPSLVLFIKGKKEKLYTGKREKEELEIWMRTSVSSDFKIFSTEKEIEDLKNKQEVSAVYFGKNAKEKAEFIIAERKILDINLGIVESESLIQKYAKPGYLVLFKDFDEKRNDLDLSKSNASEIEHFLKMYSKPRVMGFNTITAPVLFARRNQAIVFFVKNNSPKLNEYSKMALNVANKLLGKIIVFLTDINDGMQIKLAELTGIKNEDLPTIRIIDAKFAFPKKYKMKGEINEENVLKFYEEWSSGKLEPYLRSEPEPKDNDGDVKILVSNTFQREVINNDKDVVVFFFAPWCTHCKKFYPKYEDLAHRLKEKNPKLMFTKMDATENDIPDYPIKNFPTMKFYPGNKKNQAPLHIGNRKPISELLKIVKENAFTKIIDDAVQEKEPKKDKNPDL